MKIFKCTSCNSYTLHDPCHVCGGGIVVARPPKYSPEDKYARYRRMWKEAATQK